MFKASQNFEINKQANQNPHENAEADERILKRKEWKKMDDKSYTKLGYHCFKLEGFIQDLKLFEYRPIFESLFY